MGYLLQLITDRYTDFESEKQNETEDETTECYLYSDGRGY